MLGNKKIDIVDSFTYLGIISKDKDCRYSEDPKSRIAKPQGVFHSWKKFRRIGRWVYETRLE
jgi:hypothetical protein